MNFFKSGHAEPIGDPVGFWCDSRNLAEDTIEICGIVIAAGHGNVKDSAVCCGNI